MTESQRERTFTAGEVRTAAGLSYRQLNDWEGRGALPSSTDRGDRWRRFDLSEVFALTVCAELRRRFGIPVSRLHAVREYLTAGGTNRFGQVVKQMAALGVGVWLVTDLDDTVLLDTDTELLELAQAGYFDGDAQRAFVSLKVNPLVNRILQHLREPVHLPSHGRGYRVLREARADLGVRTQEELALLQLIRSGKYTAVEAVMKDGEVRTIKVTRRVPEPAVKAVEEVLREHDYQSLHLVQKDGKTVAIEQVATLKPGKKRS